MVAVLVVLLTVLISGAVLAVRLGLEEMKDDKRGGGRPPFRPPTQLKDYGRNAHIHQGCDTNDGEV